MLPYLFVLLAIAVRFPSLCRAFELPASRVALHAFGSLASVLWSAWFAASVVDSGCPVRGDGRDPDQVRLLLRPLLGLAGHVGMVRCDCVARILHSSARNLAFCA